MRADGATQSGRQPGVVSHVSVTDEVTVETHFCPVLPVDAALGKQKAV